MMIWINETIGFSLTLISVYMIGIHSYLNLNAFLTLQHMTITLITIHNFISKLFL